MSALICFNVVYPVDNPASELEVRRSLSLPAQIFKRARAETPSPAQFSLIEVAHESFSVLRRTWMNVRGIARAINQ